MAPAEQKQVPLITWLSPTFETQSRIQTSCLQKQRNRALSHDHVFHSVLGLMAVKTEVYEPALDMFANCAKR
jgi:lipid A ethanolaminephosphotransferase